MHKILFVAVDTNTLNEFTERLKAHPEDFEVLTAGSAREVPNVVAGIKVSLIVIDLKMPDMDDIEFLGYMSKNYPNIPMLVMTAFGTPDIEEKIKAQETCHYYEKPVDVDQLMDKINEELQTGVGGQIRGIGLSSFLQMSEMEKTSCKLKIKTDEETGYLYLNKGQLVDAETGAKSGLAAAHEIISWENTVIEIDKTEGKRKKVINMPLMNILMEGLRIKDEREAEKNKAKEAAGAKKAPAKQPAKKKAPAKTGSPKKKSSGGAEAQQKKKASPDAKPKPKVDAEAGDATKPTGKKAAAKQPAKPKKGAKKTPAGKKKIAVIACLVLVVLGSAAGAAWLMVVQPMLAEKEYKVTLALVADQVTLEEKELLLKSYVDTHAGGAHVPDAKSRIKEIKNLIQERDYAQTVTKVEALVIDADYTANALNLYRTFLAKYPLSPHVSEIKERMAEIPRKMDDHAFDNLKSIPENALDRRLAAYREYLNNYPEGKHRDNVKNRMANLGELLYKQLRKSAETCAEKRKWDDCINEAERFADVFPKHARKRDVIVLRNEMRSEQVMAALKTKAKKQKEDYVAARHVYSDYLEANPQSPLKRRIMSEIVKIDKKIKEANKWNEMYALAKNKNIDIFKRMEMFENYLKTKASMAYRSRARVVVNMLKREKAAEIRRRKLKAEEERKEAERLAALAREKARIEKEKQKAAALLSNSGGRYVVGNDGTVKDTRTGLMWYILDSHKELNECLIYDEARSYVENLEAGGYTDWRLPTTNDLLVIMNNKPYFPETGANWYWTSESYWKGYHEFVKIVARKKAHRWEKMDGEPDKCGSVRAVRP